MKPDDRSALAHLVEPVLCSGVIWRSVGVSEAVAQTLSPLWPEERAVVANAVAKRQREFVAGRVAARRALQALNGFQGAIPAAPNRSPCWPAGVVGSISHDETQALAVVALRQAWRSLGVDMECIARFHGDLASHICREAEVRTAVQGVAPAALQQRLACFFCIKEAVYKAQHPLSGTWLDFGDLEVTLPPRSGDAFTAVLQRPAGPFETGHGFVGRCAWDGQRALALMAIP